MHAGNVSAVLILLGHMRTGVGSFTFKLVSFELSIVGIRSSGLLAGQDDKSGGALTEVGLLAAHSSHSSSDTLVVSLCAT